MSSSSPTVRRILSVDFYLLPEDHPSRKISRLWTLSKVHNSRKTFFCMSTLLFRKTTPPVRFLVYGLFLKTTTPVRPFLYKDASLPEDHPFSKISIFVWTLLFLFSPCNESPTEDTPPIRRGFFCRLFSSISRQ